MKASFRYLPCIVLLCTGFLCPAQTITFRVITQEGKPLEHRKVSISTEGFKNAQPIGHGQVAETDQNGEVKFTLASPPPGYFFYYVDLGSPYWYCRCNGIPKTEKVVQTGIVESAANKDSKLAFNSKPGEILIVARKFTFMQRLLYPIEKE